MGYKALYRTWRPRTFADLVGQRHITQTLQNAIENNTFAHAYLFSGPRGTGKTSAAKIFAQAINCEEMPAREPCNTCSACVGILDGSISDVIEIDAASNTSVDDIRDIRERVTYAPSVVPYKVYIIDEVHMISVNAFNALLKTLEEPPSHVLFILATTEPHKIPMTIISRCQRFDFRTISNEVMVERMQHIVQKESFAVLDEALHAIALAAQGGMRDALSILDQAISYSEGEVTVEDVLDVTGGVSQDVLTDIGVALYEQNTKETVELFDRLIQHGKDPGRFVFDLIYFMRDLLFYKTTPELESYLERAIVTESFRQLATEVKPEWIEQVIIRLTECEQQLKWSTNPKIFVEVTLIALANRTEEKEEVARTDVAQSSEVMQLKERITKLEGQLKSLENKAISSTATKEEAHTQERPRVRKNFYDIPFERIRQVLDEAEKNILINIQRNWAAFLEQLKNAHAPAHATIQDSRPVAASSKAIVVAFKYEIHCSLFLEHKEMVQSMLANHTDPHHIIPIPEEAWYTLRAEYVKDYEKREEKESTDPVVDEAVKLFGDDIVEIKE